MKKLLLTLLLSSLLLGGCSSSSQTSKGYSNNDVKEVPTSEVDFPKEGETYYTKDDMSLCVEVNGGYRIINYFTLDKNNENLRIYDDMYFYTDDLFYMITSNYKYIYASLVNGNTEYGKEYKEQGYDIEVDILKSGIYTLKFDISTLKFDLVFKEEIVTPRYYTIEDCEIHALLNKEQTKIKMEINPENEDELILRNQHFESGTSLFFLSFNSTSQYKVSLGESNIAPYLSQNKERQLTKLAIGGNFDITLNVKTYVVDITLLNPESADFTVIIYENGEFISLEPSSDISYMFTYIQVVDKKYASLQRFYTAGYEELKFEVIDNSKHFISEIFMEVGTYQLTLNLFNMTLVIDMLGE